MDRASSPSEYTRLQMALVLRGGGHRFHRVGLIDGICGRTCFWPIHTLGSICIFSFSPLEGNAGITTSLLHCTILLASRRLQPVSTPTSSITHIPCGTLLGLLASQQKIVPYRMFKTRLLVYSLILYSCHSLLHLRSALISTRRPLLRSLYLSSFLFWWCLCWCLPFRLLTRIDSL